RARSNRAGTPQPSSARGASRAARESLRPPGPACGTFRGTSGTSYVRTAGSDPSCRDGAESVTTYVWAESAARVRSVVDTAQPPSVDVAVQLRRREGAVAEQLLDRAQVGATLEQVRRKRVPQPVGMREDAAERRRVEALAAGRDEDGVLSAADELRPRLVQIARQQMPGLLAERDDALLPALAAHVKLLAVEVDVREVEPDGFRRAQAGGVDELDERPVPQRERPLADERLERGLDLRRLRRVGEAPLPARRQGRVRNLRRPEREAKEASDGGDLPRDRRRRQFARPRAAELGDVVHQHAHVDVRDLQPAVVEPPPELLDV